MVLVVGTVAASGKRHLAHPFAPGDAERRGPAPHPAVAVTVVCKKQITGGASASQTNKPVFYAGAALDAFRLEGPSGRAVTIRVNPGAVEKIKWRLGVTHKVLNIELDPPNRRLVGGGAKPGHRRDLVPLPGALEFWEAFNGGMDDPSKIQATPADAAARAQGWTSDKYGHGLQRAVWVREVAIGSRLAVLGRVVMAASNNITAGDDGDASVTIELDGSAVVSNLEKDLAATGVPNPMAAPAAVHAVAPITVSNTVEMALHAAPHAWRRLRK